MKNETKQPMADPCREALEKAHTLATVSLRGAGPTYTAEVMDELRAVARAALATENPLPPLVEALEHIEIRCDARHPVWVEFEAREVIESFGQAARAALKLAKGER